MGGLILPQISILIQSALLVGLTDIKDVLFIKNKEKLLIKK